MRLNKKKKFIEKSIPVESSCLYELFNPEIEALVEENKQFAPLASLHVDEFKNFLFVPDNITSSKKHFYFTVPRFGSILAYRFTVPSFLNTESFDDYVVKLRGYKEALRDIELHREKEERQFIEKLEELTSKNLDTTELEEEYRSRPNESVQKHKPVFEKKEFLILYDTLGSDERMNDKILKELLDYSKSIKEQWEEKNLGLLENDVTFYLQYQANYDSKILNDLEKELISEADKARIETESLVKDTLYPVEDRAHLINYGILEGTFNFWRERCREVIPDLMKLKEYNFVKFPEIFQTAFFLLNFRKDQINFPNSNLFNWKLSKEIFTYDFFDRILSYQFEGNKTEKFPDYQFVTKFIDRLTITNMADVGAYYTPLFIFANFTLTAAKLRLENVRKRRIEYQMSFNLRQKAMEEAREREEKRINELEKAKQDFYSGENQDKNEGAKEGADEEAINEPVEFNEGEWFSSWNERNPAIEIPVEPIKSIDNDLPAEYVFA